MKPSLAFLLVFLAACQAKISRVGGLPAKPLDRDTIVAEVTPTPVPFDINGNSEQGRLMRTAPPPPVTSFRTLTK